MWFATDGGLAKYDGQRTQAITAEGLPPGRVLALKLDPDGMLWIGTDGGAARLSGGKFEALKETNGKVITAIITPTAGRALLASESGVVFDYQLKPGGGLTSRAIPDQPLQSADKDHPGLLKITSLAFVGNTLYAGSQSRGLFTIEDGQAKEVQSKPRSFFINALETDAKGHLLFGVRARSEDSGFFDSTDPLKPNKSKTPSGAVMAITRGAGDEIWAGSDGRGAFRFKDGKTERFSFEGTGGALRSDHVFAIFVDREDVVWFGTDKGVCRYDPHAMRAENVADDPAANYVRALFRTSRGRLLAGTNAGLFVNDAAAKTWQPVESFGRRVIYAMAEEKNGRVLVATASGLYGSSSPGAADLVFNRVEAGDVKFPQGDSVRAIEQAGGSTYVATYGYGIERVQGSQRTLVWPAGSANDQLREVVSLHAEAEGKLFIGTASAGVFLLQGKQTTTESGLDKLKGITVWAIAGGDGGLWIATGHGIFRYQAGQLKEIVPDVNARAIVSGSDNGKQIWCPTVGNGLLAVGIDDQFGPIVSRIDVEQGLPSQRAFAVLAERGGSGVESLVIGTSRGIARYEPGSNAPALSPTRIISQRVHQPDELRTGFSLEYPQRSLVLDVAAASTRTFPEQFQYGFLLFDGAGKIVRQKLSHDAQFAMEGLRPGKYKVVARAFTKDLVASSPLAFEFSVAGAPFPWTTTALAVLLLLALIALTWAAFEHRRIVSTSGALAAANRELAGARLQLANETEAERRRIARDLHDQTLADLRNLMLSVDQLPPATNGGHSPPLNTGRKNQMRDQVMSPDGISESTLHPAHSIPTELRAEIESISQEVRRICEDLSPSVLQNVGFAAALEFALAHAVEHAPPDCKFEYEFVCNESFDEVVKLPSSVQIQVYRIAQEALSNICRHAKASRVKMTVSAAKDGMFELKIEDNGSGFDAKETKKKPGRGVANIRARASMIEAEVSWARRDGGGTVFELNKKQAANVL